ncbi:hypothetical protein QYE76_060257 [Lolium multiflorum]|uniref:RING-type domain-containing protein n=1 Tax=Lolium multiflorum TaxID=4521 RepID=A0AAD8RY92_LOLMU|nr:hypothetical protein QYE76_059591 [Lolium multiflorum]KAK1642452.1 hypothetical protein QYE76_060257 [Lolium multiflorum]
MTLSEQLATPDPAIREFLRIPDDDSHYQPDADAGGRGWKPLRDRLRLRRTANAWTAPSQKPSAADGALKSGGGGGSSTRSNKYIYAPGEATAAFSRTSSLRQTPTFSRVASTRVGPTSGRAERAAPVVVDDDDEEDEEEEDDEGDKDQDEAPAAQMSLMALLEQTDSWDDEDEEEDEAAGGGGKNAQQHAGGGDDDEDDGEGREEEMVHVCCVCMVRHKGAAFIPCGHTFCRLCSRELWVSRGNCPLCNGFIQEILDIF